MYEEKPNKTKRQVFVPSTAHTRGRQTTINLPKNCRDVPYRRIISLTTGVVELTPVYRPPEKRNEENEEPEEST